MAKAIDNVKIVSNGTRGTTRVYDREGKEILGITDVRIVIGPNNEMVQATLTLTGVDLVINVDEAEKNFRCVGCGKKIPKSKRRITQVQPLHALLEEVGRKVMEKRSEE